MKVKVEKLAERCEICHQRDCFDAKENYCLRCEKITQVVNEQNILVKGNFAKSLLSRHKLKSAFWSTITCGSLMGLFLLPYLDVPFFPLIFIPLSGFLSTWFYVYKLNMPVNSSVAISLGINTGIQFTVFLIFISIITAPLYEHFDSYVFSFLIFFSPFTILATVTGSLIASSFMPRKLS
ncbi:MAG: hypothetical protein HY819_01195 [Acidobacteria bacterium]|nr:hypothetical protein [Acidobacteriota bacterium]